MSPDKYDLIFDQSQQMIKVPLTEPGGRLCRLLGSLLLQILNEEEKQPRNFPPVLVDRAYEFVVEWIATSMTEEG